MSLLRQSLVQIEKGQF
ncbi:hypothetical protein F383_38785 [Gossypium arboreum]|uniref:Uncharacterized protein n=1 Tax=Gossypium arboreum TaxID=29729 RepID=A0A0B0MMJ2_GOSAR|nr:hypothetical protein F383_38785 [Gossypium arboreum]